MKMFVPRIASVLKDKTANNLVVAILFSLSLFSIASVVSFSGVGVSFSGWWSYAWRQLAAFGVILIIAELISRIPKI